MSRRSRVEYNAWWHCIDRCNNTANKQYKEYGGRGISVCEEWKRSFDSFLSYIGPRPSSSHSLDRINNDGNYEPGNVRWSTRSTQRVNTRKNRGTKSKYRGVSWDSSCNKWWVEITRNKVTYRLGRFDDEFEAHQEYEKWRAKLDAVNCNSTLPLGPASG